ncbi:MAG: hypothetical protein DMF90_16355 [Acidobacteria bacterium]|nr:MAG: hypothetical protein DMF90_16355 [Acidobacteriota bacterium]
MSIITKRALSRRTILRGLGATVALPLLDGMIPALTAATKTAARPIRRLGCIYVPNGMEMRMWTPKTEGAGYALSPILEPLKPFYDQTMVLSGLADKVAVPLPGEGIGDHARASSTWLTGVHVKKTEGPDIRAGVSMDQIAAQTLGKETQLASLELALDSVEVLGACDAGYSCAYANTISWRTATMPLPMENDPRAVFERLFGASNSTNVAARLARIRQEKTILDVVTEEIGSLSRTLGSNDRQRLNEYLDAVRDVERRIQTAETQSNRELPVLDQPQGIPDTFEKHIQLMYDLLALAYQADLTRVGSFMISREVSSRSYPQIGVPDGHHACSHHQNDPAKLEKLAKINSYHVKQFTYFLEKLRNTPDGDGSLLDHSTFIYGSGISDGNIHFHLDLPMLVVGGGAGQLKGGRHLRYKNDTPLANLYVSVLDKLGVPTEQFGDSTGKLEYLTDL